MFKTCAKCGKIHPYNKRCFIGDFIANEESKARRTNAWRLKSEQIREDANYLCEVCKDKGVFTYENLEVHHIVKLRDAPDRLLDDSNLICLCEASHKLADKGLIPQEKLFRLVQGRMKSTPRTQTGGK